MSGPTDPAEAHFDKGLWGFDGTAWHKLPMLWGYTDRYAEVEENTSAVAGFNWLVFSTVPAGEVWVVTGLCWVNVNTACSMIIADLFDGVTLYGLAVEAPAVANGYYSILCNITMKAGDCLKVLFGGCTLNDDIYAWAFGYKMAIAE